MITTMYSRKTLYSKAKGVFDRNNYDGFILSARDIPSIKQDAAGTLDGAINSPIGLWEDKHLGLVLGPELVDTINTSAAWTASGTNTVAQDGDAIKITYVDNATGAVALFSAAAGLSSDLTVNKFYRITYEIKVNSGSCNAAVINSATNQNTAVTSTSYITQQFTFQASNAATNNFTFANLSAGEIVWVKNISVRLLDGNHPTQSTSAARPSLKQDANGKLYAELLGTDDCMTSATGGGGSAGGFWCFAMRPTGGAGTFRALFSDFSANTGYSIRIGTGNNFIIGASNGATETVKLSTATIDVGTPYILTAKDDGANLSVQIGNNSAESVARPTVVAGTAQFTIGKANDAASGFLIGDIFAAVYIKNACPSAADIATIKAWIASEAGITL